MSEGRHCSEEQPNIVCALNDREALAALPEGGIGRAYYDFVHAEGLSADGLIASSHEAPRFEKIGQDPALVGRSLERYPRLTARDDGLRTDT